MPARVVVVDDDEAVLRFAACSLKIGRLRSRDFPAGEHLLAALQRRASWLRDRGRAHAGHGRLDLLQALAARRPLPPVIVITGHGEIPMAVRAMKLGARDSSRSPSTRLT